MNATRHPRHDEIVAAIRANSLVGRGTCSPVDECFTDDELVEQFGWVPWSLGRRRSVVQATAAAKRYHRTNRAFGDDIRNA